MPLPEFITHSPRLVLRPVNASDLDDLMVVNGDAEVTRFLPYATWASRSDAVAWLERMSRLTREAGVRQLVIERTEDSRVVGAVLLFKYDEASHRVEIGYVVGRQYWRQGYAHEALQSLLNYLFTELQIRRVEAEVNPENLGSVSLLERLGFTYEGHLRERYEAKGQSYGVNVYGMLVSDWH